MLRRFCCALLGCTLLSGLGVTSALSADTDEFSDFPDVPEVARFDDAFRAVGFYVGARAGAGWANDTSFAIAGPSLVENGYDIGLTGSVFAGLEIPDLYMGAGVRLEGELGASRFAVDTHTVAGAPVTAANSFGSTDVFSGMVNVYVDYGLGAFRPFIGGGMGVGRVTLDHHGVTTALNVMDDTQNAFAWQAMAGLGFELTSSFTIEAMVRYQDISDVELVSSIGSTSDIDLSSTQVLLGARFSF